MQKIDFKEVKNIILGVVLVLVVVAAAFLTQVQGLADYFKIPELVQPSFWSPSATEPETQQTPYLSAISYEQAVISAVKSAAPSVVSIIISKNLPVYEQEWINPFGDLAPGFDIRIPQYVQKGTELKKIGAGSGFIVSADGIVVTNKHVVLESDAEYTVFTNDGQKYTAKVLALDPVQDLAVVKIQSDPSTDSGQAFQPAVLGDSDTIQIGQTAIAIGNALGEFTNTVSVGVVSGLQRTISASDQSGSFSEVLQGIIQTDAAINEGNSGGPLLNLKGEVIGINTAVAQDAQSIGFAIPINMAKRDITQVRANNQIVYPFLGVRYVSVDASVQQEYGLPVDYGAYVLSGSNGEPAVNAGSAAEKAGVKTGDIILELNGEKITGSNSLSALILKYNPGDKITLKILRNGQELTVEAALGERSS